MFNILMTRRAALLAGLLIVPNAGVAGEKIYQRKGDASRSPNLVRAVQEELTQRGYNAGPLDGLMGPRTEAAIRNFQSTEGMPVTGVIDRPLLVALGLRPAT